jgi:hypothetical protein
MTRLSKFPLEPENAMSCGARSWTCCGALVWAKAAALNTNAAAEMRDRSMIGLSRGAANYIPGCPTE